MQGLVRKGKIIEINYQNGAVKVLFSNKQKSGELFLLDSEYKMPSVGDLVAVIMFDAVYGICLGSFYNQSNVPVNTGDKWCKTFKSGEFIEYDEATRELTIEVGKVILKGDVKVVGEFEINGNLEVTGTLTADSINGGGV